MRYHPYFDDQHIIAGGIRLIFDVLKSLNIECILIDNDQIEVNNDDLETLENFVEQVFDN